MRQAIKICACALAFLFLVMPVVSAETVPAVTETSSLWRLDRVDGDRGGNSSASTSAGASSYNFVRSQKYPYSTVQARIKEYQKTNSQVAGWLTVPNTNINLPIPLNTNTETRNNYYLYRTWDGVNYPNTTYLNFVETATYADYRSVFGETWRSSNRNTVLYGHNWTNLREPLAIGPNNNHIMFGQLPSYTNREWAQQNPYIYFSTDKNEGIWKVFAVAYCEESSNFFYNNPRPDDDAYAKLINEWKQRSMYDFGVDVNTSDRIITLSTCTRQYSAGASQRFVVVARLLRDGESENDAVTVRVNENMKQPQFGR